MGHSLIPLATCVRVVCSLAVLAAATDTALAGSRMEDLAKSVGVRILTDGTSHTEVMNYAKTKLPYEKMSSTAQRRAKDIVENASQFRRMPCLQYEVDRNVYQYLVNNPDVAVSTWRVMGISKLQMHQTAAFEYEASCPDGSEGIADVLWRDANQCLFVVKGQYNSPILPSSIHASALVWLQYRFVTAANGATVVNQQVETFIFFPSHAVDVIARLATRVTNTILDRNVFEVSLYARMMSQAVHKDPRWVEELAGRMDGVLPKRRTELIEIARQHGAEQGNRDQNLLARLTDGKLSPSGEFRQFEYSMHQLNQHIPLVPHNAAQRDPAAATSTARQRSESSQRPVDQTTTENTGTYQMRYFGASGTQAPRAVISPNFGGPEVIPSSRSEGPPPLVFTNGTGTKAAWGKPGSKSQPERRAENDHRKASRVGSVSLNDSLAPKQQRSGSDSVESDPEHSRSPIGGYGKPQTARTRIKSPVPDQSTLKRNATAVPRLIVNDRNGAGKPTSAGSPRMSPERVQVPVPSFVPAPVPPVSGE